MDDLKEKAAKIMEKMDLDKKRQEVRDLELQSSKSEFWQDNQAAAAKMRCLASLQQEIQKLEKLEEFLEFGSQSTISEDVVKSVVDQLESKLYLSGPHDLASAIISIHSGQGGVEAMDWAEMLYRMYSKYVSSQGWKLDELDYEPGSEAGIKTVTFQVTGDSAYGYLKHEAGVHRLVRLSPFNADHLRQTSFALVEVMPLVTEGIPEIEIREEDLKWDFFRSGGHGGQNVNKVSSAVRVTHLPSGIVVSSQKERDQSRNREIALKILTAKLLSLREEDEKKEQEKLKGKYVTPGWGNQIRSYILHPYHLVKDLRTDYEQSDSDAVLEGKIDGFIQSELSFFSGSGSL